MNKEVETIKPFKNFCMTIGALPTSYLESMSYYETLCWLCKYLENTINPAINNNAEALKELQEYVANYFDNLDVQEEIDNKLDEMAESGVLADIINEQIFDELNNEIGNLEELKTNDKSSLVNATNEVIEHFNIVNFKTYPSTLNVVEYDHCTFLYGGLTVAANSDYSILKLYGNLVFRTDETNGCVMLLKNAIPEPYRPTAQFNVSPIGVLQYTVGNTVSAQAYAVFKTNGDISIEITKNELVSKDASLNAIPFIIFMKDFGD